MIPYYPAPVFDVFGIPLDSWSLLVAFAFIVGLEFGRSRAIGLGLDIRDIVDGALFIVGMGFVFGHWVHVLAYNPHQIDEQGWIVLLKIWAGFSSNGGFLGAIIGTIVWFKWIRPRQFWLHADTIAFGLPFGWFFGRLGCFTAHDHVGVQSSSPLAVNFSDQFYWNYYRYRADCDIYERASDKMACYDCYFRPELMGPRFDLGLNEAILVFFICIAFFSLRKKNLHHSFFAALFCVLYAPVRFSMDFLRHTDLAGSDLRWFGLTPAQYGSMLLFVAGIVLFIRMRKKPRYEFVWEKSDLSDQEMTPSDNLEDEEKASDSDMSKEEESLPDSLP